jgi:hypothetical protein
MRQTLVRTLESKAGPAKSTILGAALGFEVPRFEVPTNPPHEYFLIGGAIVGKPASTLNNLRGSIFPVALDLARIRAPLGQMRCGRRAPYALLALPLPRSAR